MIQVRLVAFAVYTIHVYLSVSTAIGHVHFMVHGVHDMFQIYSQFPFGC